MSYHLDPGRPHIDAHTPLCIHLHTSLGATIMPAEHSPATRAPLRITQPCNTRPASAEPPEQHGPPAQAECAEKGATATDIMQTRTVSHTVPLWGSTPSDAGRCAQKRGLLYGLADFAAKIVQRNSRRSPKGGAAATGACENQDQCPVYRHNAAAQDSAAASGHTQQASQH